MKKYLFLYTLLASTSAYGFNFDNQINNMNDMFINEFNQADVNNDGFLNQEEFVNLQFENFKKSLNNNISTNNYTNQQEDKELQEKVENNDVDIPKEVTEEQPSNNLNSISNVTKTLNDMANYELEDDDYDYDFDEDIIEVVIPDETMQTKTIKEDKNETSSSDLSMIDLSIPEEEIDTVAPLENVNFIVSEVKKTLPQEVDDITSWIDITYENNLINYIYKTEIDISTFSMQEKLSLVDMIENDACQSAVEQMCKQVKSMFIDRGVDIKIIYTDRSDLEISYCKLDKETCK